MDGFAESNYHPNELTHFRTLSDQAEADYFYCVWTRKEAWLKLTGEGINDKLREIDFSGKDMKSQLPAFGHHDLYMISWHETSDYIATLAAYVGPGKIRFYSSEALLAELPD